MTHQATTQAPEEIAFGCRHCGARLLVPRDLAGVEGPCPECGTAVKSPPLGALVAPQKPAPGLDFDPGPLAQLVAAPSPLDGFPRVAGDDEPGLGRGKPDPFRPGARSPDGLVANRALIDENVPPQLGADWVLPEPRRRPFEARKRVDSPLEAEIDRGQIRRLRDQERIMKQRRRLRVAESVFYSQRFLRFRQFASAVALVAVFGVVVFMRSTGWGNKRAFRIQNPDAVPAERLALPASAPVADLPSEPRYQPVPARTELAEVPADEDEPIAPSP